MAKDTEKLIRQLSLISYLMAERRPVTAPEIRRDVEGYSAMNEDAFARRFYADRSELEALGIVLSVEKPADGQVEQETYSLPPENFHLPAIEFTDGELAALRTALQLLDGEFAYAEPLRLALQQISWGRPSPLRAPEQHTVALGITGSAGGHDVSQRLAKIETAIFRRKTVVFDYYTMERDDHGTRRVDPYQLLFQGGQFYVVGRSHERDAIRVFRLSRIQRQGRLRDQGRTRLPAALQLRPSVLREPDRLAVRRSDRHRRGVDRRPDRVADREALRSIRGDAPPRRRRRPGVRHVVCQRAPADRMGAGLGEHARILSPPELAGELRDRVELLIERHTGEPRVAALAPASSSAGSEQADRTEPETNGHHPDAAIRPERFARLVTLASILIDAGRAGRRLDAGELRKELGISDQELREDISVLNVVNFGAGTYVLYAEIGADGMVEVDPEPYGDSFARPARLLPVEAKALIAAIDLIGEHIPQGSLSSVRDKVVAALGEDPVHEGLQMATPGGDDAEIAAVVSRAISQRRLLSFEYYKENEDEFSARTVEPYALINGREGWYVASFDPARDSVRHFRLDRIKSASVSDDASSRGPTSIPPPTSTAGPGPARSRRRSERACGSPLSEPAGRARNAPSPPSSRTAR